MRKINQICPYLLAVFIPVVTVMLAMIRCGVYPFGDQSMLVWDMKIQYVDFLSYFNNILHGEGGFFYSFSKSLGGNMMSFFSYYFSSPLNFMVAFFSNLNINLFISIISVLKIGLSGLTCYIYLSRRLALFGIKGVLLCVCYALMQFNIIYLSNIMWLDGVIYLPLVMLGVYRLVHHGQSLLLFIFLPLAIVSNWYTGYMICLFSVIYFSLEIFMKNGFSFKVTIRNGARTVGKYIFTMLIAVGASFILLLPTIITLSGGKGTISFSYFNLELKYFPAEIFGKLIIGETSQTAPQIYTGLIVLALIILFFTNYNIKIEFKGVIGALLGFMVLSSSINVFDVLWNGMKPVYSYNFRYSFCFGFILVFIAAISLKNMDHYSGSIIKPGLIAVLCIFSWGLIVSVNNERALLLTVVFIGFYFTAAWYVYKRADTSGNLKKAAVLVCICILILENVFNIVPSFNNLYKISVSEYQSNFIQTKSQVDELKQSDTSAFYRFEKNYDRFRSSIYGSATATTGENLTFDIRGIAHYSSTYDGVVKDFIAALGYSKGEKAETCYNESILPSDSILGMKYVISDVTPYGFKAYNKVADNGRQKIYYNPYALSLGMTVSSDAGNYEITDNPFENQNKLYSSLLGRDVQVFKEQEVKSVDHSELTYYVEPHSTGPLYAYLKADYDLDVDVYVNSEYFFNNGARFRHNIFSLKTNKDVEIKLLENENTKINRLKNVYVYVLDMKVFEEAIVDLKAGGFEPSVCKDGYVSGTYQADSQKLLMLSIPYDEGWSLTINGKAVEIRSIANGLSAFEVFAGDNTIELKYMPPGLIPGTFITLLCIFVYILLYAYNKKHGINF